MKTKYGPPLPKWIKDERRAAERWWNSLGRVKARLDKEQASSEASEYAKQVEAQRLDARPLSECPAY